MSQITMEDILSNPEAPEAQLAVEQMTPDEREALESAAAAETGEEQEPGTPPEQQAEAAPDEQAKDAKGDEPDDLSDIPESIRRTLERRPEDAQNWRGLRGIAKDAQSAARQAAEEAAAAKSRQAALEAELAALRAQAPAQPTQPKQPTQPDLPDPNLDPGGYARALVEQQTAAIRAEMRDAQLNQFEAQAVARHGKQAVDEAFAWFAEQRAADPGLGAIVDNAFDPWETVVAEKARREAVAQMGDDPASYIERVRTEAFEAGRAAAGTNADAATAAQVEAELAKRLPTSLARAPGAAGTRAEPAAQPLTMAQILGEQSG